MTFQFDIEKLLSPLSAENPSGESLRYDGTYDRIRNARKEDDPNLPVGVWKTELRRAQWDEIEAIATEALETRSKDLQIAAWLTEAWLKLHGFSGAARGFDLMYALAEGFWDDLFPQIENEDFEFRLAPLLWVNEKLSITLNLMPITRPEGSQDRAYSYSELENAALLDTAMQRGGAPAKPPSNAVTTAMIQRSALLTPAAWFRSTLREIDELRAAVNELDAFIDSKAGKLAPGLPRVTAALEAIEAFILSVLDQRGEPSVDALEESVPEADNPEDASGMASGPQHLPPSGRIRDRAEAYALLAEIAEFLARTEPHSPTPYLVRRAIAWGSMNFEQLLPEMVRNASELQEIYRLLQIGRH